MDVVQACRRDEGRPGLRAAILVPEDLTSESMRPNSSLCSEHRVTLLRRLIKDNLARHREKSVNQLTLERPA